MQKTHLRTSDLARRQRWGEPALGLVFAALALTSCTPAPPTYLDDGKDGSANVDLAGGGGGDMTALPGLPCEVSSLLNTYCLSCHGHPPQGAPVALATYEDLIAQSPVMPGQKLAERVLARMQDVASPMPPGVAPTVPAKQIAAFKAWVDAGTPSGSCHPPAPDMAGTTDMSGKTDMAGAADMGKDPLDSAPKCTSGKTWTNGNKGDPTMHPGRACIACHSVMRGPNLNIAGTVYPSGHEPDDCLGSSAMGSATVVITDNAGKVYTLPVNASGNFTLTPRMGTLALPYRAKLKQGALERVMSSAQMNGDCNSCHTQNGASGAPGRITLPY
jgi:hypothetical protein